MQNLTEAAEAALQSFQRKTQTLCGLDRTAVDKAFVEEVYAAILAATQGSIIDTAEVFRARAKAQSRGEDCCGRQ